MSHKALILLCMHSVDLDYCFVHVMMLCFFNVYVIARAGVIFVIYFTSCRYSGG